MTEYIYNYYFKAFLIFKTFNLKKKKHETKKSCKEFLTIESFLWVKKLSTNQLLKLAAFIKEKLKNREI